MRDKILFAALFVALIVALLLPSTSRCQQVPNIQDVVVHPEVLKIGGTARLLCTVINVAPGVSVFWSKVDTQNVISADDSIKADTFDEQSHVRKYDIAVYKSPTNSAATVYELVVHKLQMLDGGLYRCHLYMPNLQDNGRFARVTIVVPPRITVEVMKPVVKTFFNEPEVRLSCKASGQPAPNITWSRFAGPDSKTALRFKDGLWVGYGETMIIKNIEPTDAGVYRCKAKNDVDPDDVESAQYDIQLQVHYRPTASAMLREVGQAPNKNYYSHLDCRIVGFPVSEMYFYKVNPAKHSVNNLTVDVDYQFEGKSLDDCLKTWEIDQGPLKQTSELLISHHQMPDSWDSWLFRLEVRNVRNQHYGYYMCSAQNSLGTSCAVIYFYETTHCQGTWCPDPLQPAQQLGATLLSPPSSLVALSVLSAVMLISLPFR